tara:strand:- start:941 stop:1450 length:510 start_codon:yes stop_codon:yes gene_type:complete
MKKNLKHSSLKIIKDLVKEVIKDVQMTNEDVTFDCGKFGRPCGTSTDCNWGSDNLGGGLTCVNGCCEGSSVPEPQPGGKTTSQCPCADGTYSYECCPGNAVPQGKQTKGCPCPPAPQIPGFERDTTDVVIYHVSCCPQKGGGSMASQGRTRMQEVKNQLKKVLNNLKNK